jgi:predicted CXXCH cytochrome family protein
MRFKTACLMGIVLALAIATSAALSFGASITGTAHDLKGRGWGTDQTCIFCHTPHNANSALVPLWNHTTSGSTYVLYASGTLNATAGQPGGASKACLSCHDGSVALDSYGGATGTHNMTGDKMIGVDLSNDHPVGFTYDAALATADGGLVTPASVSLVVTNVPLFSAKVECATCHNVHDNGLGDFLRVANAGSALCLKCHNK